MEEFSEKKSFGQVIVENKEFIYPSLFYIAGLVLGSFCFNLINNTALSKLIELIFNSSDTAFNAVFLNRFSLYFSIYVLTVLLGMCLIGFPFINLVPLLMGCEIAIKTAYYYVNFNVKGVGFALLMIIPEGAAIATVLVYSIKTSTLLSKNIYDLAAKGSCNDKIDIKSCLKKYLLYGFIVAIISLINALASFLLSSIIKL